MSAGVIVDGADLELEISEVAIASEALRATLRASRAGACVEFEGWVRDHHEGRAVTMLWYEAHPVLARREGGRILREARQRYGITAVRAVHRVGRLEVGEVAVWIGVSAAHREDAFAACRFVIDELKKRVPIWKKEVYRDGSSRWIGVGAADSGDAAEAVRS